VASTATATAWTGQESREERVELGQAVFGDIDRDLRVLRIGSDIRLHLLLLYLLVDASIAQVNT
jgi:hypothetical protein